jgi:hypothetical protein
MAWKSLTMLTRRISTMVRQRLTSMWSARNAIGNMIRTTQVYW